MSIKVKTTEELQNRRTAQGRREKWKTRNKGGVDLCNMKRKQEETEINRQFHEALGTWLRGRLLFSTNHSA